MDGFCHFIHIYERIRFSFLNFVFFSSFLFLFFFALALVYLFYFTLSFGRACLRVCVYVRATFSFLSLVFSNAFVRKMETKWRDGQRMFAVWMIYDVLRHFVFRFSISGCFACSNQNGEKKREENGNKKGEECEKQLHRKGSKNPM